MCSLTGKEEVFAFNFFFFFSAPTCLLDVESWYGCSCFVFLKVNALLCLLTIQQNYKILQQNLTPVFSVVLGDRCGVEFEQRHICAARGSSVVALCSFYNSGRQNSNKFTWTRMKSNHTKAHFIVGSNIRKVFQQFEYIGDHYQNCSMIIQQVETKYAGRYFVMVNRNRACPIKTLTLKVVGKFRLRFETLRLCEVTL